MNYQTELIHLIEKANTDFLRSIKAMPQDKLEWQPLEGARPALNLLQECAQTPGLLARVLEQKNTDWFNDQVAAQVKQERLNLQDITTCETLLTKNTQRLITAIKAFSEEDLSKQVTLPFGAGGDWTMAEIIQGHYWNTTYHLGQINYIQTLYGDTKSH